MSPAKRFLIIFAIAYAIPAIGVIVMWGPPGMSGEWLEQGTNEDDYELYLEFYKDSEVKLHLQNPERHPLGEERAADAVVVEAFEKRDDVKHEFHRRHIFELFFEFWNVIAVVVIVVYFAKKPLLGFLDSKIDEVRERIESADTIRTDAEARHAEAKARMDGIEDEVARINEQAEALRETERDNLGEQTEHILEQLEREIEERKELEETRAVTQMRDELIERAFVEVEEQLLAERSPERQAAMLDQFTARRPVRLVGVRAEFAP